ncbi:GIY-YIG nuclease family protein [Salisediminibacterium beveridgei]|uniref:GIY-YIG nuclease family protein n=1 Tax=Salisediminibacterium beveridgei TaxID=632773 RepID=UPI0008481296|nr:GIY-YIG nuclease family protein [Salisediminibacterium beveridgei]
MSTDNCYVYILRCKDNSFYTGYTTDPKRRLNMHEQGKGARYTKGRGPFILEYLEILKDKGEAMRREYAIKALTRSQKEQLIASGKEETRRNACETTADI